MSEHVTGQNVTGQTITVQDITVQTTTMQDITVQDITGQTTTGQPIEDTPERWPVISSEPQLRNRLISVRSDHIQMPDHHRAERVVVAHPGAVAVVPLDEAGRVLMLRQYRHPVGYQLWEIPAGLRDADGEPPLETAKRELLEETGYTAADWHVLVDYFTSPGFTDERIRTFLARGLASAPADDYQRHGEERFLSYAWVPLAEAVTLALAGKLHNSAAVTGILAAHAASATAFTALRPADAPEG
jgi:8-oxo-dGDP phosphatase